MNKKAKSLVKKTAKIAGVTCVAAGAVAVMTSGVALKAIAEGGKYLADEFKRIINEENSVDAEIVAEPPVEVAEEATSVVAKDIDFQTDENHQEAE